MNIYAGVDCGATNLRLGVVDEVGKLLASATASSPLKTKPELLAETVAKVLEKLNIGQFGQVKAMGVGTPGPLDLEKGLLLPSANLGNREAIDLRSQFDRHFNFKIYFDRDTNLGLLGEFWRGAAVGVKDAVMLTLGSGVGGAIMVNGEIEHGESGKAGEIGHIIIQIQNSKFKIQNLPRCGLSHTGCLEAWINSAESLEEMGTYLGYGLANIVNIFNPEKIIIGGGKVKMGDFLPQAISVMKKLGMKPAVDEVEVVYAKLEELSGVYGGARLAMEGKL